MMKKTILFVSLMLGIFSTGTLLAATVGTLTLEKGLFKLRRNAIDTVYRESGKTISVEDRDEIQTGGDTQVKIHLNAKGDDIELTSSSFLIITGVTETTSELEMPAGKARFKIKKRKRSGRERKRFRLKTANALIGVKGTEFIAGVSDGNTSLLTLEGSVSMANISAPEVEVEVKVNQASQIKKDAAPTTPMDVPPKVREEIIKTEDPKVFNNVQYGVEVKVSKTDTKKKEAAKSDTTGEKEEAAAEEEPEAAETAELDVDIDEIIAEVEDTLDAVVEETDTGPTEKEVILDVTY